MYRWKNTGDYDCYVRVKALAGSKYQDGLQYSDSDGKWTPGEDGYYYYSDPIAPGESTSVLDIRIDSKESDASFNVVVVQESTKVLYNENNERMQTGHRSQIPARQPENRRVRDE